MASNDIREPVSIVASHSFFAAQAQKSRHLANNQGVRYHYTPMSPVPNRWTSTSIPKPIVLILALASVLFLYGIIYRATDPDGFYDKSTKTGWIQEDGLVEWLTVVALFGAVGVSVYRALQFGKQGRTAAKFFWWAAGFVFLFGAMEEFSWGQRVFGWESPPWFMKYNYQHETTLHNLKFGEVNLNKLIFSKMLGAFTALYLLVLPVLYRRTEGVRKRVERYGIAIVQNYQLIFWIAAFAAVRLFVKEIPKTAELLEFIGCALMLVCVSHPFNHETFARRSDVRD